MGARYHGAGRHRRIAVLAVAVGLLAGPPMGLARAVDPEASPGPPVATADGIVCDGRTDIGPTLDRLGASRVAGTSAVITLPGGTCLIDTPVTFRTPVWLRGQGWPEAGGAAAGTTLRTTNPRITPLTVRGAGASGATIADVAIEQAQPEPGPGWVPVPYPPFFQVQGADGVRFRHILGNGIDRGIDANGAGRLSVEGLWGEFFRSAIVVDHTYDAPQIVDVHVWPFWLNGRHLNRPGPALDATLGFEQAHLDAIRLLRVDSPRLDRIFVFGAKSAVSIEQDRDGASAPSPGGTATKVQIGMLDGDSVRHCLRVSGTGATVQFASMTCQGQAGASGGQPLPGATAITIEAEGDAVIQGGALQSELDDRNVIAVLNKRNRSVIGLRDLFVRQIAGGPGSAVLAMETTEAGALPHQFSLATPPFLSPSAALPFVSEGTTNAILSVPGLDDRIVTGTPPSGATYAIRNTHPKLILQSASDAPVPALTVAMPPNPYEGLEVTFMCTAPILRPTFTAADPILHPPMSLDAWQAVTFKWTVRPEGIAWLRLR